MDKQIATERMNQVRFTHVCQLCANEENTKKFGLNFELNDSVFGCNDDIDDR